MSIDDKYHEAEFNTGEHLEPWAVLALRYDRVRDVENYLRRLEKDKEPKSPRRPWWEMWMEEI